MGSPGLNLLSSKRNKGRADFSCMDHWSGTEAVISKMRNEGTNAFSNEPRPIIFNKVKERNPGFVMGLQGIHATRNGIETRMESSVFFAVVFAHVPQSMDDSENCISFAVDKFAKE